MRAHKGSTDCMRSSRPLFKKEHVKKRSGILGQNYDGRKKNDG